MAALAGIAACHYQMPKKTFTNANSSGVSVTVCFHDADFGFSPIWKNCQSLAVSIWLCYFIASNRRTSVRMVIRIDHHHMLTRSVGKCSDREFFQFNFVVTPLSFGNLHDEKRLRSLEVPALHGGVWKCVKNVWHGLAFFPISYPLCQLRMQKSYEPFAKCVNFFWLRWHDLKLI